MKKITLFLVAMTMSLLSFAAQPKRIYAYDLSSTLVDKVYTFSFTANETPTSGKIIFYDATSSELVGEIALTNPVLGKNEVEIAEYSLPGNDGQQLNWAVELSAAAVTAYEKIFADASHQYRRGFSNVDISPESDYFGTVYVADWCKTKTNSKIYVYNPVYSKSATGYNPGSPSAGWGCSRFTIAPNGNLWLTDYSDGHSGLFLVDPADLTKATQFFAGTRASSGLIKNGDVEVGSSLSCATLYGTGANTKLVTVAEDYTGKSFPVAVFNVGQEDGSLATSWTTAPNILFNTLGNAAQIFDVKACEKGVWVATNRGTGSNDSGATSLRFYTWDGACTWSSHEHTDIINGNLGGGIAITPDEKQIVMKIHDNNIAVFDITWNEDTPTLTTNATFNCGYAAVSAINLDYAGNIVTVAGTNFGNTDTQRMSLVVYSNPTANNTCEVPAKKADVVTKVEAAVALYTVTTNVNDPTMGSVSGNLGTYEDGASAELTAVANDHYEFTGWTGDVESTDNPLTIIVDGNKTITANFAKKQYTLTVSVNDGTKGSVNPTSGTYAAESEVQITAEANPGFEFTSWSNGSKENPLTISMEEDTELTANFRAILPSSITLNAHPVKDYSASIDGTMKRAIQNGENTIVLTHEDNGTPHIYNIVHATKTVTEISQEGVNAAADGFLSISDIAVTEDGKLVACNYVHCTFTPSNTSYFYIWNDLAAAPSVWFTSQKSGNYNDAYMGYTMALKGTSQNAEVTISAFNKSNSNTRYSHLYVVDGTYSDASYKYSRDNVALHPNTLGKNTYELNASPLAAGKWIVDGELTSPIEFVEKNGVAIDTYTALSSNVLGKKYNGASYLFHKDHHLMIAPYAADDKLAGVKVLGITDGFGSAVEVTTSTNLASAINAEAAAATAYVDGDGDLTIYLFADSKVFTFSEKVYTAQTFTVTATAGEGGSVEGGGTYEEGATATLTATPDEHYDFVNWTVGGSGVSTDATYSFEVTTDVEVTANFQEHTKYTITAHAADNTMGYVTGGKAYYAGETVTLKAVANSTYYFVNWSDGNTDAIRTFTATADVTLTANFAKATPRAWAYDLKMVEDGDNYKFSFNATTAANATLLFLDKEGNELYAAHEVGAVAAGANTISIEKAYFTQVKDVYWSVKMDGEAITSVAEITDQSRGIYDFYSTLGVTVDNNPNSEYFGKVYVQATLNGGADGATTRADEQTAGLFIYNQWLDELNPTSNVGIQPSLPAGYGIGGTNQFNRLAIDPITNNITYCYAISGQPAVFSMDRADLTGTPANLLAGQSGITRSVAHCFDTDGALYVMDLPGSGTIYKIKDGVKTQLTETTNKFVNPNITMTSDGRGGLWVSQNRGQMDGSPYYYQLAHVTSAGAIDWAVNQQTPHGFEGGSSRGALAYDSERQILAQGRNGKVELYTVAYDATTGVPTLTPLHTVASDYLGNNIDGLAFDFAGDLYVVNSSKEKFQKFTLPTAENICTVSAPESQAIIKEVRYIVTVNTVGNGTATGAGEYVAGETATFEASPAAHHKFVNWTYGSETSTNNPLELVVNSDITVTANFAPVQYTLIAPTNDEDKGTVTGAGAYNYGTEVTLTATPKEGYKLLYWSDRSTENPRTITMTKNEAISAYFVKEYDEEPTFKIEKIWENAQVPAATGDGYQAVGWDQKIYMQNKTAGKIQVFSNGTNAATDYATSNTSGQQIAVDEAGNLIVFNATFSTANPNAILIYQKGSTEGKAVSFTLKAPARCDFFSASGDIYSASGGYVYFYCAGKTVINRLKITNGAATTFDVTTDVVGEAVYSSPQNTNYVMVDIFGNLVAHARSNAINAINVYTNESKAFTLPSIKMGTLGGCSFELGGKELWAYHAGASNYSSEWNIYNMTDSKFLSDDDFYAVDKEATTNYACNWLNVQVVDEYTAYIYQFCPKKAVALWKVTLERDDLQEFTVTATANDPAMGTVTGEGTYYEDATATLTATANTGYRFVNWTKGEEVVSTDKTYTFTVTENVTLTANFEKIPEIAYELNGGQWNKYGWTSKKDMYDAFIADWKVYSGSTRATKTYEEQLGIGKSNAGIPTTIQGSDPIIEFMEQEKWAWLGEFLDALATAQSKATKPTAAATQMRFALGNFFGEDNNNVTSWVGAVDCSAGQAVPQAFQPTWGQSFPNPTQPAGEVVLGNPVREGYGFGGWYAESDFSGAAVTTVDENTDGTLYAKWIETIITVTIDENANNTAALAPYEGETVTATVTRNFGANKILTVTLPFDMNASQISNHFGNATVYEFYNVVDADVELHLQFTHTNSIEAGKPYILQTTSGYDAEDGFTIKDVTINTELTKVKIGDLTMVPVLDGGGTLDKETQYYLSNNALYCAGEHNQPLPGLRAFFTSATSTPIRARVIFDDNEATSIPTVIAPKTKAQKIIQDGRLIIIRGEHQYNAQGQMIE